MKPFGVKNLLFNVKPPLIGAKIASCGVPMKTGILLFTSSTVWSIPAGIKSFKVTVVGPGGKGGDGGGGGSSGGGGGAGGTCVRFISNFPVNSSAKIVIGNPGSSTTFDIGTTPYCIASTGVDGGNAQSAPNGTANGGQGGIGILGDLNMQGGGGGSGNFYAGNGVQSGSGLGGSSFLGGGGRGSGDATDGVGGGYGSGGSAGADSGHVGGPGSTGVVMIEY